MRLRTILCLLAGLVCLFLCSPISGHGQSGNAGEIVLHLKFKPQHLPVTGRQNSMMRTGLMALDNLNSSLTDGPMQRLFPEAGKFEDAHRAYGLHLWYEIRIKPGTAVADVLSRYRNLAFFDLVEERKDYSLISDIPLPAPPTVFTPNDPMLSNQWHLRNTGQTGGTPGADIDMLRAWTIEKGGPEVIVAVIDQGVDFSHPDLAGQKWINTDEIPGNNIDDDHNGYIDDVNGYNFADSRSRIPAGEHGTHVAGIIAAGTNNATGVAGAAGGDGSGDGVRIMSCVGFGELNTMGFEAAMVYAADNGAVISQNSWGGGSNAIEPAIMYFVERAGLDNSSARYSQRIQIGPMAGGLVVFAAGNASTSIGPYTYPASYPLAFAVASTDHQDVKSWFSNYGAFVDISAPGSGIWSTIPGGYGPKSGTSMACPVVSGIAALVVSKYGGLAFSPTSLRDRLTKSADNIDLIAANVSFAGQLGTGRVNAFGALQPQPGTSPAVITDLRLSDPHYNRVTLRWTATGGAGIDGVAQSYDIRFSDAPITAANFLQAQKALNTPEPPAAGEPVSYTFTQLERNKTFYFAIQTRSFFGDVSVMSNVVSLVVPEPAKLEIVSNEVEESLYTGGVKTVNLHISNPGADTLFLWPGSVQSQPRAATSRNAGQGRLFVALPNGELRELNITTGETIRSFRAPFLPGYFTGLAFDNQYLYYTTSTRQGDLFKIDANTGQLIGVYHFPGLPISDIATSGSKLYVMTTEVRLLEVDPESGTIVSQLANGFYLGRSLTFTGARGSLATLHWQMTEIGTDGSSSAYFYQNSSLTTFGYSAEAQRYFFANESRGIDVFDLSRNKVLYTIPLQNVSAITADETLNGWLESFDNLVTVLPGAEKDVPVTLDAWKLGTGQYQGSLKLNSNAADTPTREVEVSLTVTSAPDISAPGVLNIGPAFVGIQQDTTIRITNDGLSNLSVVAVNPLDATVTVPSFSATSLSPGASLDLVVRIQPVNTGAIETKLAVISNDPDEATFEIPIEAIVNLPPELAVSPSGIEVSLLAGAEYATTVNVSNPGTSPLHWQAKFFGTTVQGQQSGAARTSGAEPQLMDVPGYVELSTCPGFIESLVADSDTGLIYAKATVTNSFYRYDPRADHWQLIGETPDGAFGQPAYCRGTILFVGDHLSIYNIVARTWTIRTLPGNQPALLSASDGRYIYVVQGVDLLRFDPLSGELDALSPIPENRGFGGGLSYSNGALIVNQGDTGIGGFTTTLTYKYFIDSDMWVKVADLPTWYTNQG